MNNVIIIQGCHSGPEWKVELITKTAFICFEWNLLRLHPILTLTTNQSASFFLMRPYFFSPFLLPWWSLSTPFLPLLHLLSLKLTLAKWVVHGQLWHSLQHRNPHGQSQVSSAWWMKINSDQFSSSIHWASFARTNEGYIIHVAQIATLCVPQTTVDEVFNAIIQIGVQNELKAQMNLKKSKCALF